MSNPEYFETVDKNDRVIGRALRSQCHSNPKLIHRGVFVIVINLKGEILLQKRSKNKDLYPGVWDIYVGGHNKPGDTYKKAAQREMREELGLKTSLNSIGKIFLKYKNKETEFDMIFETKIRDQKINFNKKEIEKVKFLTVKEIKKINKDELAPKVLKVLNFYQKHK